jgi:hypothetical protein
MTRKTSTKTAKGPTEGQTNAPAQAATDQRTKTNKIDQVKALLRRREGATLDAMVAATGWQAHTVRGAMSGALKRKAGLTITSDKVDGVRTYRIATVAVA